ncbi:hypothetical protein EG346_05820 [Chryseobacterium carnipullorum]|uniref:Nucleotidyltransferase domain-containing protein n=1 Tax=Chryseobacterium carnipullorum TaxID=1124835 RepID=A0A376EP98_CHRCU|nr:hypothetical protein [Chryseobacterium carnipullorum]AZA47737.1 hypothetical protein EG346_05820 [Chryseobacterium carnipullorum]AZA67060.1 hypothetical protein EG345_21970 [Chryseobacterium carnipullorum]STD11622.1 Uncharacterised protein [Chryseobacterium carnipullorum]HBV13991.1 hypothetical protein [Chryseobacterium carnipullorum]
MSRVKPEAIWQHDKVLPYILTRLKDKISEITAVEKIFLFGSRGRIPFEQWEDLEGKDWDVLVQAKCKLKNAMVLVDQDYHLDLLVLDENQVKKFTENMMIKQLFPINELKCLINKNKEYGNI